LVQRPGFRVQRPEFSVQLSCLLHNPLNLRHLWITLISFRDVQNLIPFASIQTLSTDDADYAEVMTQNRIQHTQLDRGR